MSMIPCAIILKGPMGSSSGRISLLSFRPRLESGRRPVVTDGPSRGVLATAGKKRAFASDRGILIMEHVLAPSVACLGVHACMHAAARFCSSGKAPARNWYGSRVPEPSASVSRAVPAVISLRMSSLVPSASRPDLCCGGPTSLSKELANNHGRPPPPQITSPSLVPSATSHWHHTPPGCLF